MTAMELRFFISLILVAAAIGLVWWQSGITWGRESVLLLVLPALIVAGLTSWWRAATRQRRAAIGAGIPHLTGGIGHKRELLRSVTLWTGLMLLIVVLAGPRWGAEEKKQTSRGADVLLVLDCSRSMLADDLYPNRLAAARRKALALLEAVPETRLALMPFAAIPSLRCPLTGDHNAIELMLKDCDPGLFPAENGYQGTAIGEAVQAGLKVLNRQTERGQSILVMSDGADEDKAAVDAAGAAAKALGVPVYGIFFGDPEREVKILIDGKEQVMSSDRSTLDTLATTTGGLCVNARNDGEDITVIHNHLKTHVVQLPWEERRRIVQSEKYQYVLIPAILLLVLGMLVPTRRN